MPTIKIRGREREGEKEGGRVEREKGKEGEKEVDRERGVKGRECGNPHLT